MIVNRIIKIILIMLGISFVALEAIDYTVEASGVSTFMFILLMVLYCRVTKIKEQLFFSFLLVFSIAHFYSFIRRFLPLNDYSYYIINLLYILSYSFLIALVVKEMNFKKILSRFPITIVILIILNVFCVTLVTDTAGSTLSLPQYILEFTYNVIVMLLLSVSLIRYMNRDDNKSMLFLVGSIFIFFSEMIQLAYFYISRTNDLGAIYSIFLVLAFTFFYLQSKLDHTSIEDYFNKSVTS